ncbi:MAG: GTPase Era [Pseudoclavibacter sp.]
MTDSAESPAQPDSEVSATAAAESATASAADRHSDFHAGFVAFVGRPNAGKSTLMNALVGEKVAITSAKPQTTRRAIRGILTADAGQIVVVDTPGLHRPRTLLGQRLNDIVEAELDGVDVVCVCLPADEAIGPGDRRIIEQVGRHPRAKRVALLTKTDRVRPDDVAARLVEIDALAEWATLIPVSAVTDDQVDVVRDELIRLLPASQQLYDAQTHTEDSIEVRAAELIREAMLEDVRDELPHSLAVVIDDVEAPEAEGGVTKIYASVFVERDSQKGIIIGRGGQRLKAFGTAARKQIEQLIGGRVHLDLRVKVAKEWQTSPKLLDRLGF